MSDELKKAQARIKQLEEDYKLRNWAMPPEPDPSLAEDEWWAVFGDYRNLTVGSLSKVPWQGGSNMTSTFKVKRIP